MKFQKKKQQHKINKFLYQWIPVIDQRDKIHIKLRLIINYLLEILILISVTLKIYFQIGLNQQYIKISCLILRLIFFFLSFKSNKLDISIISKIIIIVQNIILNQAYLLPFACFVLILQLISGTILALSCEQRRGKFDQRLNLWIPFFKQILIVLCSFLVTELKFDKSSQYYLIGLSAVLHTILSYSDSLYNFQIKKYLAALSIFNLIFTFSIIGIILYPQINPSSIIVLGITVLDLSIIWLYNATEHNDFKLIEKNPSTFSQWQYLEYFEKMIFLIKNRNKKQYAEILRGFYNFHLKICSSPECPIQYSHELDKQIEKQQTQNVEKKQHENQDTACFNHTKSFFDYFQSKISFIQSYLKNQMEIATIKNPELKSFFIFYISPNVQALKYCDKFQFLEYREYQRIQLSMQDKDIQFKNEKYLAFRQQVKQKIQSYLDVANSMWRLLYDQNVNMSKLEDLGNQMLLISQQIKQFQNSSSIDSKTLKFIYQFRLRILDQNPEKLKVCNQQNNKLYNFIDIQSKEQPIVIISAQPESFEKIQNVNASACSLLGYSKLQILQKNINSILPQFIGDFHHKLLVQRSKKLLYSEQKKINTLIYAITGSGYLMQTKLQILQLNSLNGRRWSVIFQPTYPKNYFFITDEKGVIQGLTANCLQIHLSLNIMGKSLPSKIFTELTENTQLSMDLNEEFQTLFDEQIESNLVIKTNIIYQLGNIKMCVFEIVRKKPEQPQNNREIEIMDCDIQNQVQAQNPDFSLVYNYPNLYSTVDLHQPIDIKVPQEQHYQFINFGEGINQMRYFDGQIQFKEDKSESSFTKQNTASEFNQIVNFSMKKQTYLEALQISNKNLPPILVKLTLLFITFSVVVIGVATTNFIIFYLGSQTSLIKVNVLSNIGIWYYQFLKVADSALEIGYINSGIWSKSNNYAYTNMTNQLNALTILSQQLTQNQSFINQFLASTQVDSQNSFYDVITNFKLQTNIILNNKNISYNFNQSSPIQIILTITSQQLIVNFENMISQLTTLYINSNNDLFKYYIIMFASLIVSSIPFLFRIYTINRDLNQEKSKLLSIFLEVQQKVVKKLIQTNNQFKLLIKYNKQMSKAEENEEGVAEDSEQQEQEKSARKRIKSIQKMYYFSPFLLIVLVSLGIYSVNISIQKTYFNNMGLYFKQIYSFNAAHLAGEQAWIQLNTLAIYPTMKMQNYTNSTSFIIDTISNVYITQMNFRQDYLMNLNQQLFSSNFVSFFLAFWVSNGCAYMTYQLCPTDYNKIFNQGADQVWSLLVRKIDYIGSVLITLLGNKLPKIYPTYGNLTYNYALRNITMFYETDITNVFNNNLVTQISNFSVNTIYYKTIIFCGIVVFVLFILTIYLFCIIKCMRNQMERVEKIVGFIPFRELVNINQFKMYIKKKYQNQIY